MIFLKLITNIYNRKIPNKFGILIYKTYSLLFYSLLSIFAQVSLKPTVLLKTKLEADESLSTQKYPKR